MANVEKKKKSKWWIALVVIIIIAIAASGESEDKDANPKKVASSNENEIDNIGEASDEGEKETEELQTVFKKGDVLETENLKVTFADCGEFKDYEDYAAPDEGNKVVYLDFEFENISDADEYVSSFNFSCYADGYDCESYYFGDVESLDATLSAGKKTKGTLLFEVPKDAKEIQVEYEVNFWTEDKIVFVVE